MSAGIKGKSAAELRFNFYSGKEIDRQVLDDSAITSALPYLPLLGTPLLYDGRVMEGVAGLLEARTRLPELTETTSGRRYPTIIKAGRT